MSFIVFFVVVIAFSLTLCAVDKIRSYKKKDKTVWIDVDSVVVKLGEKYKKDEYKSSMTRIS
ncbi:MAG: hypothetical protein MJZ13_08200 [Bacteroidales bacterium]|nr:hypothetical protein [Bacteroidales bacterium]